MSTPGSTLLLLTQLPTVAPRTKVRFLGCVTSYDAPTATLTLTHPPSPVAIAVNVSLVAAALGFGRLRDGEWVNVIGYTGDASGGGGGGVEIEAVMVWSAGGVELGEYEGTVGAWVEMQKEAKAEVEI